MSYDPRAISNAILDIADAIQLPVTNIGINKILYFAHATHLTFFSRPLVNTNFEAWQFGPVLPAVYHQFKVHGAEPITSRATIMCAATGDDVVATYSGLGLDDSWLLDIVEHYGNIPAHALVALSHESGGAWDIVWNRNEPNRFGMAIPDRLIEQTFKGRLSRSDRRRNVH